MPETLVRVVLPEMGESVSEGSVTGWRKAVGDRIAEGEPLVDVTTDKVDVEVPAPASGTLARIVVADGATVPVGALLAEIDTSNAGDAADVHKPPSAAPAPKEANGPATQSPPIAPASSPPKNISVPDSASPLAKRLAYVKGVDVSSATGTGPGGALRRDDVAALADGRPAQAVAPAPADATLTPLKGPAASLASYMEQSLQIPTATSFRSFAVDVMDARRRELNAALATQHRSEKVSFTHLIAFAIVKAAGDVPSMATSFRRGENGPERVARGVHLGIAVDMQRKDGSRFLIVPVIHGAPSLDFKTFHATYETLVAKARTNTLT
ncbi:MAG TPA: biotin/lipoyl-containing protein, partial [Candidatus Eremiobacteraceae bacterium]|nr:biotin/lipoyl-containing protein [Candidatus Eremiobacteraceae bacterium]